VMMIVVGGVVLGDGLIRTKPTAGVQRTGIETLLTFCQKPFSLEGVPFNVDSRCNVILDLLKSELLLENIK
jgi:hypothetical protein